jgi:hypothetical protein
MKTKLQIMTACLAVFALCAPGAVFAATKKSSSPAPSPSASPAPKTTPSADAAKTARPIPFRGKISAADQKAKTFTIAGKEKSRVFKITNRTILTKAGAAATMKDVLVNEEIRGSYWKVADGSLEAKTVKLGPPTEAEKAAASARAKKKSAKTEAPPAASPSASPSASASPSPAASAKP